MSEYMLTKTLLLTILIVITFIILSFFYIKKRRKAKAIIILRNSSEIIVNQAMKYVADNLKNIGFNLINVKGQSVADVWGPSVVGYNYEAQITALISVQEIEKQINLLLNTYCQQHGLVDNDGVLLQISDIWVSDQELKLDVVYLINPSTKDYLEDLKRL